MGAPLGFWELGSLLFGVRSSGGFGSLVFSCFCYLGFVVLGVSVWNLVGGA